MGMISVSSNDKNIELTSLEAHVALCAQRQSSLEKKVADMIDQQNTTKKIVFRAAIALVTGGLSGLTALIIHVSGKLL